MTSHPSHASFPLAGLGQLFTLRNAADMCVTISERGAALVSWWAPDRYGRLADVVLGCSDARALPYTRWELEPTQSGLCLRLAGHEGVRVHYRLGDDGSLAIEYEAAGSAPLNLGAHPYFNLNGGSADVGDHMLQIDAGHYIEVDAQGMPLRVAGVGGTAFDFRRPAAIGARLAWPDPQLDSAGGFNHRYCLGEQGGSARGLRDVARVVDPGSGRCLQVSTTGAGMQFYSARALDGFCLDAHADMQLPGQLTVYRMSLQEGDTEKSPRTRHSRAGGNP